MQTILDEIAGGPRPLGAEIHINEEAVAVRRLRRESELVRYDGAALCHWFLWLTYDRMVVLSSSSLACVLSSFAPAACLLLLRHA